jgi:hypothetical protein
VHLHAAVAIKEYLPQDIVFRSADGTVSPAASEHLLRYRQGLDAFLVEARTLASFRHRAIVRVVHEIQRRMSMQTAELTNYLYKTHCRY